MAERQQDHFGSPMAAGARGAARGEREGKVEVRDGFFFLARCCLGQVPGGAPFSQRSELATACTNRMQIRN